MFDGNIIYVRKVGGRMAKKRKKKKLGPFILLCASFLVIIFTTFTIFKYWTEIYRKYQEKNELAKELVDLQDKEEELAADVDKLQDADYIARYAREKYFYSKDGEYILKIPEDN